MFTVQAQHGDSVSALNVATVACMFYSLLAHAKQVHIFHKNLKFVNLYWKFRATTMYPVIPVADVIYGVCKML